MTFRALIHRFRELTFIVRVSPSDNRTDQGMYPNSGPSYERPVMDFPASPNNCHRDADTEDGQVSNVNIETPARRQNLHATDGVLPISKTRRLLGFTLRAIASHLISYWLFQFASKTSLIRKTL